MAQLFGGMDWVTAGERGTEGCWGLLQSPNIELGASLAKKKYFFFKEKNVSFLCPLVLLGLTTSIDGQWGTGGGPGREGVENSPVSIHIPSGTIFSQIQKQRSCRQGPDVG